MGAVRAGINPGVARLSPKAFAQRLGVAHTAVHFCGTAWGGLHNMKGIEVLNTEFVPAGGALIIPGRLSDAEMAAIGSALPGRTLTRVGPDDLAVAEQAARAAVLTNSIVIFQPTVTESWNGQLTEVPRDQLETMLGWGLPVLPLAVDRPADWQIDLDPPDSLPQAVLCFAKPLIHRELTLPRYQEALLGAGEEAFSSRSLFKTSLTRALVRGLKRHGSTCRVIDGTDESTWKFDKILAAAIALSKLIKQETTKPRIGIVLPPGPAGLIANVAALLAGKTPVNLNYTAGKDAIDSAIRQGEIDRFLTVDLFVRKMQTFPWPATKHLILLERVMPKLKSQIALWLVVSKLLPASALNLLLGVPAEGDQAEATLLFTSGSSGEPKGVALSHRNVLSNVTQFGARLNLGHKDSVLGCLPLFHSFGCTVTMWYPMLHGLNVVTFPSPLEIPKLAGLIEKYGVTLLISTPTFLRGYLRKVKREQLSSLKFVVTGAEKLPSSLRESFSETFGKDIMEGYGLTETSPASNVNLPNLPAAEGKPVSPSHRPGSVGQTLPGLAVRITDAANNEPLALNQSGIIWFKGSNVFNGYLKQPRKTEEVLQNGWFRTGDIGRMDEDGFLFIEGRLSRFSKIGGEMVPHETVEEHINRALGLENESERKIAVVGVPDPDKGEALILLTCVASDAIKQEIIQLRYALLDRGVPALWIPKKLVRVEEIPLLASGKLDLKKCEALALTAS